MTNNTRFARIRLFLGICILLLASLACTTVTRNIPSGLPFASELSDNGRIGYLGSDGNVYMIDENGDNLTSLTEDAQAPSFSNNFRLYQYPTWSPDGRHLAFISIEATDTMRLHHLLVADRETGEINNVFTHPEDQLIYLNWSPDNESISFITTGETPPTLNLRLAFLNGDESIILDRGQPYYWDWSPDGSQFF
ncbi:MAG: hypothetical protein GWN30_01200, partial [Gammaproteobacteria bacterium]|nr:hypothetical protein [Gammaproteobacteria bacterium]